MTKPAAEGTSAPRLAAVVAVSMTASALPVFLTGALAVQIRRDLHLTEQRLGIVIGTFFLVATLSSISLGRLIDRLGWRRGLRAVGLISATASTGIAWATRSWLTLALFLGLAGLAQAMGHPASNMALSRGIPVGRQGVAFGVKQAAVPIATFSGGLAVPTLALTVGWRWAFVGAAAFAAFAFLFVPAGRTTPGPRTPVDRTRRAPTGSLVLLAAAGACGAAAGNSVAAFLTTAAVESGFSESLSGRLIMLGSIVSLTARLASGWVSDRRGGAAFPIITGMFLVGAVGIGLLMADPLAVVVVAVALAFGGAWGWTAMFHLAVVSSSRGAPAAATGISVIGLYVGATVGPPAFGALVSATSFDVGWVVLAGVVVVGAVLVVAAQRSLARAGASHV